MGIEFMEKRKNYIDGMKGMACLLIMFGHYYGIYKYAENKEALSLWAFQLFEQKPWNVCVSESFWLSLFFVISGYSLSLTRIVNYLSLFKKCFKRLLRLVMPVFGACIFIFFIYKFFGFHNGELKTVVDNPWLESFYQEKIFFYDLLLEPLKTVLVVGGNLKFNTPWWCISGMFYSSICIYVCNYAKRICKKEMLTFLAVCLLMASVWHGRGNPFQGIIVASLLGMMVCWYEKKIEQLIKFKIIFVLLGVIVLTLCVFQIRTDLKPLYFAIMLGIVPRLDRIKELFSGNLLTFLGRISFGIYSFHWPVFCSVGMLMLKMGLGKISIDLLFLRVYIVSIVCCLGLAYIYHITVEKLSVYLLNVVERLGK